MAGSVFNQAKLNAWLQTLTALDALALVKGFAVFGYAVKRVTHSRSTEPCLHVLRSMHDEQKSNFVWDGAHYHDVVDATKAVLVYAKGAPFIPVDEASRRKLRRDIRQIRARKDGWRV